MLIFVTSVLYDIYIIYNNKLQKIKNIQQDNLNYQENIKQLQKDNSNYLSIIIQLQEENTSHKENIEKLKSRIDEEKLNNICIMQKYEEKYKKIECKYIDSQETIQNLKKIIDSKTKAIDSCETEIFNYLKENLELKKNLEQYKDNLEISKKNVNRYNALYDYILLKAVKSYGSYQRNDKNIIYTQGINEVYHLLAHYLLNVKCVYQNNNLIFCKEYVQNIEKNYMYVNMFQQTNVMSRQQQEREFYLSIMERMEKVFIENKK